MQRPKKSPQTRAMWMRVTAPYRRPRPGHAWRPPGSRSAGNIRGPRRLLDSGAIACTSSAPGGGCFCAVRRAGRQIRRPGGSTCSTCCVNQHFWPVEFRMKPFGCGAALLYARCRRLVAVVADDLEDSGADFGGRRSLDLVFSLHGSFVPQPRPRFIDPQLTCH